MARGRNLLPTDPDRTAGRIGRTHGVATVAMPAIKTRIIGGATDIFYVLVTASILVFSVWTFSDLFSV
jgi:hypothetical protein